MPSAGQSLPLALAHAENMLEASGVAAGQVVLITGGRPPVLPGALPDARFLRGLVVVDESASGDEWRRVAENLSADLRKSGDTGALDADMDRAIDNVRHQLGGAERVVLTMWFLLVAMIFWLALFRREESR